MKQTRYSPSDVEPVSPGITPGAAYALAALSGLLYIAAYPPLDLWPLAFVSLSPLLVALRGRSPRQALRLGFAQGLACNVSGSTWLVLVIRTFGELPWPVCAAIALVICAYNAGRPALFAWLSARAEAKGWPRGLVLVGAFAATEAVYPLLFPYYAAGQVNMVPVFMQLAELGGAILVGVPLTMTSIAVAEIALARLERRPLDRRLVRLALAGPAAALVFGAWRIAAIDRQVAEAPEVRIGIVQGNTPHQGIELRDALTLYRDATRRLAAANPIDLVVWPETALSGIIPTTRVESLMREAVESPNRTGPPRGALLAGVFIRRGDDISNSAVLFAGDRVRGVYDKVHPLAFGEYVPFGDVFPALYSWIKNAGHLTPGTNEDALLLGDHRISPLICYEDILPGPANRAIARAEPDLLVNMTNDSWFGNTAVAATHLALAKLRAVEHRRFLVHATNSGVSAFIDPVGRATGLTPVMKEAAEVQTLRWMRSRTLYERIGDSPWWGAALVVLAMGALPREWVLRRLRRLATRESRPRPES